MTKKTGGFTLIELVMVIATAGIITSIAVPRLIRISQVARENATRASLSEIRSAVRIYHANAVLNNISYDWPNPVQLSSNNWASGVPLGTFPANSKFFINGTPRNQLVNRLDFLAFLSTPTCADLQSNSFVGWLVDLEGHVWATTPNCSQTDTSTW